MSAPQSNPLQPPNACCECDAMWRVYSQATAEHLKQLLERDMAMAARDLATEDRLNDVIVVAEKRRTDAREVIRQHEAVAHASAAGAGNPR